MELKTDATLRKKSDRITVFDFFSCCNQLITRSQRTKKKNGMTNSIKINCLVRMDGS